MLDFKKLREKLSKALANETKESLENWLNDKSLETMEMYRTNNKKLIIQKVEIVKETKEYVCIEWNHVRWKKQGKFFSFHSTYLDAYNFLKNSKNRYSDKSYNNFLKQIPIIEP